MTAVGRGFLVACGACALAFPAIAEERPDWTGVLRAGHATLPVAAWFDADRTRGFVRVADWTSKIYRAWKVAVADLDNDGTDEVLLGIWSDQPRHDEPNPHRTVWVLRWDSDAGRLVEAWRGSALARPLREFSVAAGADGARLVALETLDAACTSTTYKWTGFGFAAEASAPTACEAP